MAKYPDGRRAIVTYTEFGKEQTEAFLVMDYEPGSGLVGYIAMERVLVADQIKKVDFQEDEEGAADG